jgi:peptidoglycan hydrolase CwlO-like protein
MIATIKHVKPTKFIRLFISFMMLAFFVTYAFTYQVSGEVQQIGEFQDKLNGITKEEKEVLDDLFAITQEIEELEMEEKNIQKEIEVLTKKKTDLELLIHKDQKSYDEQLSILKKVLREYQRKGPASYINTLLSSGDLRTFIQSVHILRDLTHNVNQLLDDLQAEKEELSKEKERLKENVLLLEQKQEEIKVPLAKKLALKEEQEAYLVSLKEEKEYYQKQLNNLEQMWTDCKEIFSNLVIEFSRIISEGKFTLEDINLTFEFPAMKGTLKEETLNEILKENSNLPNMEFGFSKDKVEILIPDMYIHLTGYFVIEEQSILKLVVTEGRFYEMPLSNASIEELFQGQFIRIDFKQITKNLVLMDYTIESVEVKDNQLEFKILPIF